MTETATPEEVGRVRKLECEREGHDFEITPALRVALRWLSAHAAVPQSISAKGPERYRCSLALKG
jgi:hypothetical protein